MPGYSKKHIYFETFYQGRSENMVSITEINENVEPSNQNNNIIQAYLNN